MNANAMFQASFQQAVTACVLLYAGCVAAFVTLGFAAAAIGRRRLLR